MALPATFEEVMAHEPFTREPTRVTVTSNEPPPATVPWTGMVVFAQVPVAGPKALTPRQARLLLPRRPG